jgi:predicted phosphodiesterase
MSRVLAKIAVITDVHANLPALDAALAAIAREGCDAIYHTGDAIAIGPYPAECLDRLLHTPKMHLLMGNHDAWLAEGLPSPLPDWLSDDELVHQQWTHAQLDPGLRTIVAQWPYVVREDFGGLGVTFLHYALDASGRDFAPIVPDPVAADFDRLFSDDGSRLVFYGHHHQVSDLQGRARYVSPGALGCSTTPVARYAILEVGNSGDYRVRQGAVPYDAAPLFRAFEERQVPTREFILRAFFGRSGQGEADG